MIEGKMQDMGHFFWGGWVTFAKGGGREALFRMVRRGEMLTTRQRAERNLSTGY